MRDRVPLKRNGTRFYTVVDFETAGYPRVYLQTTDKQTAERRLRALQYVDDTDLARQRIGSICRAAPADEQRLIDDYLRADIAAKYPPTHVEWSDLDAQTDEQGRTILSDKPTAPVSIAPTGDRTVDTVPDGIEVLLTHGRTDLLEQHYERLALLLGKVAPETKPADDGPAPSRQTLSTCLTEWETHGKSKSDRHVRTYARVFREFIDVTTDKPVNRLSKSDFVRWSDHVDEQAREQKWSAKTRNDRLLIVAAVLKRAERRLPDGIFPDGLSGWIQYDRAASLPESSNKQPMPSDVFLALVSRADEWASIDVPTYAASLPVKGANPRLAAANNVKQSNRVKRAGVVYSALLRLCCNVGADPIDLCRLRWSDLRLDGPLPLFLLARGKVAHKVGAPIERKTPLLPSTVSALKRLRDLRAKETDPYREYVFVNDAKRLFDASKIAEGYRRLQESAETPAQWSLKHLRNVGPTLGKRAKRHPDERDAFLGHAVRGTSRFYEGDVQDDYLADLVDLIGQDYFDRQRVVRPKVKEPAKQTRKRGARQ